MKTKRQFEQARDFTRDFKKSRTQFIVRVLIMFGLVLFLFSILFFRLYYLQINKFEQYSKQASSNRISLIPTAPTRGEIIDANGVVLARNYLTFSLEIIPNQLAQSLDKTIELIQQYIDISETDIKNYRRFQSQYRKHEKIPLKLKLTDEEAAKLATQLYQLKGVEINARTFREYPYREIASHFLGYVGRINQKEVEYIKENGLSTLYKGTTHIGKTGLENFYELQLHGQPGFQEIEKDSYGNTVNILRNIPAINGQTIQLSVDIRVQKEADKLLGDRRGAVIALDPQTGGVIALVSKPSFDNNLFIDGIGVDTWNDLNNDWERPLINRATQGLYPPGSTFKPFLGLVALETDSIKMETILPAPATWSLPNSRHLFRGASRGGHGNINLRKAIQVSSDTFFYRLGNDMGIDKLSTNLKDFGFGEKTGIDLPSEYIGVLPSRQWKDKRFSKQKESVRKWIPADTVAVSIGQGYNAYTPLQMAFATAILANNGIAYRPHLAKKIIDHKNQQVIIIEPNASKIVNFNPEHVNYIKAGMQDVLQPGGTAWRIGQNLKYSMGGKTGTAQVVQIKQGASYNAKMLAEQHRDHAWFIAFAPVENPQIAVAVLLENGGWGANAAPIAKNLIDFYLLNILDNGETNSTEQNSNNQTNKQTIENEENIKRKSVHSTILDAYKNNTSPAENSNDRSNQ